MICTFFGHRDAPREILPKLKSILVDLIENKGINTFYIGNQGSFDYMAKCVLKELHCYYPHIKYTVILAYHPVKNSNLEHTDYTDTMYPEGLENTPLKYAIPKRNMWLIDHSDTVVTYVKHTTGGAARFKELAEKRGKTVINIH